MSNGRGAAPWQRGQGNILHVTARACQFQTTMVIWRCCCPSLSSHLLIPSAALNEVLARAARQVGMWSYELHGTGTTRPAPGAHMSGC